MIENNIFGINERFIGWKSDLNGLVDDYLENSIVQEEKTGFNHFSHIHHLGELVRISPHSPYM